MAKNLHIYFSLEHCSLETFNCVCELNRLADNREKSYALTFANNFSISSSNKLSLQTCNGIREDCFFVLKEIDELVKQQITRFNMAVGIGKADIVTFTIRNLLCINIIPDDDDARECILNLWNSI